MHTDRRTRSPATAVLHSDGMTEHEYSSIATDPTPVRVSGEQGAIAAVAPMLGFEPRNSLVLMCISGPRRRVGPVVRSDLDAPAVAATSEQLVHCAVHYADEVVVACYHDSPDLPATLGTVVQELVAAEVPVVGVLSVHDGRIRDARSTAAYAADPGVPLPTTDDEQVQRLTAAMTFAGRHVLPHRQALVDSIAAPRAGLLPRCRTAVRGAREQFATLTADAPSSSARILRHVPIAFAKAWAEQGATGGVSLNTAADLIALAADRQCRDRLISLAVADDSRDVVPLLISVVTQCPDADGAGICAVLAVAAYRHGDGALAQCAVDRVFAVDPDNRLAHLLASAMAIGLPPHLLADMSDLDSEMDTDLDTDLGEDLDTGLDADLDADFGADFGAGPIDGYGEGGGIGDVGGSGGDIRDDDGYLGDPPGWQDFGDAGATVSP